MTVKNRNILLAGVPRSGKTFAARRIAGKLNLSHIPLDAVVTAFQDNFPEHGIVHHNLTLENICRNFFPFLTSLLKEINCEGTCFCADSYHVSPQGAQELKNALDIRTIFLGYPLISIDQKFDAIRSHAKNDDWTISVPDDQLRSLIARFIAESQAMQIKCKELGIPFIDTGKEFERAIDVVVDGAITYG